MMTIFRDRVYNYGPCYILDSCMVMFQYSAAIWWNPSVPLCGKPYQWRYLMAELTTLVVTLHKMDATLIKVTEVSKTITIDQFIVLTAHAVKLTTDSKTKCTLIEFNDKCSAKL